MLTGTNNVDNISVIWVCFHGTFDVNSNRVHGRFESCLAEEGSIGYIMGLAHIIFNKSNKTIWCVTLNVVWFNIIRDFD